MRLIDADELVDRFMSRPSDYYHTMAVVEEINDTPTAAAENSASAGVHFDGWVSVKEKAPEVGKVYIVYAAGRVDVGRYIAKDNWLIGSFFPQPTHWMELPEFPKEAGR